MAEKFAGYHPGSTPLSPEERIRQLEQRLYEVMIEVEALRRDRLADLSTRSRYIKSYCEMSRDSHDSAGPFGAYPKVGWIWDGTWARPVDPVEGRGERPDMLRQHEWAMLLRLGLTDAEIEEHLSVIDDVSSYT